MSTGLPVDLGPGSRARHGRVCAAYGVRLPRGSTGASPQQPSAAFPNQTFARPLVQFRR